MIQIPQDIFRELARCVRHVRAAKLQVEQAEKQMLALMALIANQHADAGAIFTVESGVDEFGKAGRSEPEKP